MTTENGLQAYLDKRDFAKTPEPSGANAAPGDRPVFVIHQHDASNLHYDLRLEVDGVLKSWAIPKGPSTDPSEKRLAVPTEDHPLDYADFEGVIPEGEYGAGPTLVWDAGIYRNQRSQKDDDGASMQESLDDGKVEVWLEGEKLQGGYAIVRTGDGEDARWLFIKMDDDQADARRNPTSTEPRSVLTGRTLDEVASPSADQ
ncbi:MAG: DNA polymerase ligase N-terminal domain-containing protein [Caldilineales bacterium]